MGQHRKSNSAARTSKYQAQFARTEHNKQRHIEQLKAQNPNWPNKKEA